ncbi:MAG: bifunctional aldolase/short-chain dehydrogenase [Alphaproteobacteria bacterium]|jgi:rhamnulose-1-phosphate aldolase/alcohol dehydrogenase|nr:bifunctional aldolase/short-chain dehydrogenase [Alphaproteobacteria bacterium]
MDSLWRERAAEAMVTAYAGQGIARDLALRIYTTRLLGGDARLVLHGGGNTSVKTRLTDGLGDEVAALCVKGSGWDMARIQPEGLPALRLETLGRAQALEALPDEAMVDFMRGALLSAASPNPSVETLLHAFLPDAYVDHTHASAILTLSNQPDGEKICREALGERIAVVPYVMSGFGLAKEAARVYDAHPGIEGLVLSQHGIVTFGAEARQSYERMIELVSLAERYIGERRKSVLASAELPREIAPAAAVAPILRGLVAEPADGEGGQWRRMVLAFRGGKAVLRFVAGAELDRYARQGVATPDHTIRTKNLPLIVPAPAADELDAFKAAAEAAVAQYRQDYDAYFARHDGARDGPKTKLDPLPRVVLVPGLGLFGLGKSVRDARIATDITESNIEVISDAEAIGSYRPASEADMFDIEYWSLEQAKLGREAEPSLQRQVALITGAGGGIGAATARCFAAEGAAVALLDRDAAGITRMAEEIGEQATAIACDVTDPTQVRDAFERTAIAFGGVDIVVSNAGAAWQGKIGEVSEATLRQSFELNFFAHQTVAQNAVRVMAAQGTGGVLLFNVSKQAVNPGAEFGPYGLPKAATLFLSRQYALEYGEIGIRANAVNADRVNTGLFADGLLEERAAARGLTTEAYLRTGNLLQREVKADDVAQAFLALALAQKTTAAVLTVDGGNIAAALR